MPLNLPQLSSAIASSGQAVGLRLVGTAYTLVPVVCLSNHNVRSCVCVTTSLKGIRTELSTQFADGVTKGTCMSTPPCHLCFEYAITPT